jgi:hypothetical protein
MNNNKPIWIVVAVMVLGISAYLSFGVYQRWQVYKLGELTGVTIMDISRSNRYGDIFIRFNCDGKVCYFNAKANPDAVRYVGERIQLRHLNKYPGYFMFPSENPFDTGRAVLIPVFLVGFMICVYRTVKNV